MKKKELNEKIQLLKAGQIVEIDGNFFRAVMLNWYDPTENCTYCDLDSICHDDVLDVCCEMETINSKSWILKLCHQT